MLRRKRCSVTVCLAAAILTILGINILVYCLVDRGFLSNFGYVQTEKKITETKKPNNQHNRALDEKSAKPKNEAVSVQKEKFLPLQKQTASYDAAKRILATVELVQNRYANVSEDHVKIFESVINNFQVTSSIPRKLLVPESWATGTQVLPQAVPELGTVLYKLCTSKILKADNTKKGTQLKLLLTLQGGYKALFKPQWYGRDYVISGPVYAGKDRHNAEVAAFHLSLLLGFRRVPLTVGRRIDLRREVMPVASSALRETFYQEGNNTCFYGVCYYCSPSDPVCAQRDIMEGALILWLPTKLTFARFTHPWQRSYRKNFVARWEVENNYCDIVKKTKAYSLSFSQRLLDLVDTAIFDFLVDNGDRHHFEAPINLKQSSIFLFDNGKSFGNPNEDHIDILGPLYQCCVIRKTTWETLLKFRGGILGELLDKTLRNSHIYPVLNKGHLHALNRRIEMIYAAVEICLNDNQAHMVLL